MAVGKSKKMAKKGSKKKAADPFTRKEWYDIKAPTLFENRQVGKTIVNKTVGTKLAADGLKGRVYEVSLGDLNKSESDYKKFKLICEAVSGRECLTSFYGMDFTRDKLCSIVKKWHTKIEATATAKTNDGYLLRIFCVGITKRAHNQIKKTTYCKSSKTRAIRAIMVQRMQQEVAGCDLKEVIAKLIPDSIGKDIEKACYRTYPMQDVHIRKVKVVKKPKFELGRLMEQHGSGGAATTADGTKIDRPDDYEPPVQESV